jgi:hypothetical protein
MSCLKSVLVLAVHAIAQMTARADALTALPEPVHFIHHHLAFL